MKIRMSTIAPWSNVEEANQPTAWVAHIKKYNASVARKVLTPANLLRLADSQCWYSKPHDSDPDFREVAQFIEVKDDAGNLLAIIRRVNGAYSKHTYNNTAGWYYNVFVNFPAHNGEQFGGGNLHLWRFESSDYALASGNYTFHGFDIEH